jgi:ubiquinone/menaquinone biosynthesis C-methylase UbiE
MGFYVNHIFPRLMDWGMSGRRIQEQRAQVLAGVHGQVLEIGFGTGLNLPHYPKSVTRLIAVEPGRFLETTVAKRSDRAAMPVEVVRIPAEELPWEDEQFDCVVSTWTLCAIAEPVLALRQVRRVLKPDGQFVFLEHGRSDHVRVAAWQDRLNPLQRIIGCGCNVNRRIDHLINESGLKIERLDRYALPGVPRVIGEMYRGIAVRA